MGSPCIDVCRYDDDTGWCLGCGMARKDKKNWKKHKERRDSIRAALPDRLVALAHAGNPTGEAAAKKKSKEKHKA
jgi:predicted Fe-S protein YdhL (DUF1289 family)